MKFPSYRIDRRQAMAQLCGVAGGLSLLTAAGCSKMLLGTGKVLFGDPKTKSEFSTLTRDDLVKSGKTILIACSTPEFVESETSTLKLDLIDGITRRLKRNFVKIINPDRVADWIDEHDGLGADLQELARDFETDYIAVIDVQSFGLREPNSPNLLRGSTSGLIRVFKVEETGGERLASTVYTREFAMTYPQHQPMSETGRSSIVFHKEYVARLCDMLAERFYDHRPGTSF